MTITDADHPGQHYDPVSGNWVDDATEETPTEETPEAPETPAEEEAPVAEPSTEAEEPTAPQTPEPSAPVDEHAGQTFNPVTGNWEPDGEPDPSADTSAGTDEPTAGTDTAGDATPTAPPVVTGDESERQPDPVPTSGPAHGQSWLDIAKAHFAAAVDAIDKHLGQ